ncbi:autotransporter outer membrane beta-barrel domain-containing protein [Streptosporangium sp. NPDC051022]|uniref:autotransporter outer membrane beta-barrel domain-containing protein n=1 Tax=Streptosporangium sp. NPDC051022 TaxID=3155752 RepID=UPI0034315EE0
MRKTTARRGIPGTGLVIALALVAGVLSLAPPAAAVPAATAAAADLPYGPYTCKQNFVWRDAFPYDYVCVTVVPDIRRETAEENRLADERREPNGGPWGPDTCKQGFVWREANRSDHVCVYPSSRSRAWLNNANAAFGLQDPSAPPRIFGTHTAEDYSAEYRHVTLRVTGAFSRNSKVTFSTYGYHGGGWELRTGYTFDTGDNGRIITPNGQILTFYCDLNAHRRAQAFLVATDHANGQVSNPGKVTDPLCISID